MAIELGITGKAGSWFTYGETRIGQGRENARSYLDENPSVTAEMEARVREMALGFASGGTTAFTTQAGGDAAEGLALAA